MYLLLKGIAKIFIRCGNYSRAETIQGRKLLNIRRFRPRKLFEGGNYSRAETIRGNTVTLTFSASVLILLILFPYDKSAW